jgi:ATP-binding cassette subfamily F protein 2
LLHRTISLTLINRLLDKIAKQILVCDNKTIKTWDGTIAEYKNHLRKKMISSGAV